MADFSNPFNLGVTIVLSAAIIWFTYLTIDGYIDFFDAPDGGVSFGVGLIGTLILGIIDAFFISIFMFFVLGYSVLNAFYVGLGLSGAFLLINILAGLIRNLT